jgi:hypothetical protein
MIISNSYKLIGGIVLIGVLILLGWVAWDKSAPGALIAGIAGIWGAIKANLFGESKEDIREEHTKRRTEWAQAKSEFDQQVEQLKERMEHLDYRSQQVTKQLTKLDVMETAKLQNVKNMSAQEKARLLDSLI